MKIKIKPTHNYFFLSNITGGCFKVQRLNCGSNVFQWCQRLKSRIKSQASFKNQKSRSIKESFKNKRVVQSRFKNQVKNQEKTQLR